MNKTPQSSIMPLPETALSAGKSQAVDEYIAAFPPDIRLRLQQIRTTIRQMAPTACESFKYRMPAYALNGPLVYFASFRNHIGFYPMPDGIVQFKEELAGCRVRKGTIQFPHNKPLPLDLIARIVQFRVQENRNRAQKKNEQIDRFS